MNSPADWGVVTAVLGLMLATLVMAAVVKRHQAHRIVVQAKVRRLESSVQRITEALAAATGVPLTRELRLALRHDVVACYRRIRILYRRYPAIDRQIEGATQAAASEGPSPAGGVGRIEDDQALHRTLVALDDLLAVFEAGAMLQPPPRAVRAAFARELGERRAEVLARYHLVAAKRFEQAGDVIRARAQLTRLMQVLRDRGPSTDFVRELYAEAHAAYLELRNTRLAAETLGGPGSGDAVSSSAGYP